MAQTTTGGRTPTPQRPDVRVPHSIVGRQAELTVLADAVGAIGDRGAAFLVAGEPGIGVSTVLRGAAEHAASAGCLVLTSAGIEDEAALPFAALHRLLQPVLPATRGLPPVQRQALQVAFGLDDAPASDPFLVALGTLNLLTHVAALRPVVSIIDSLQWIDQPSARILTFVARRLSAVPVLMLCGLRQGSSAAAYDTPFRELTLARLDEASARLLLTRTARHLTRAQQDQILTLSAGNPLALLELSATAAAAQHRQGAPDQIPWISAHLQQTFVGPLGDLPAVTRDALLIAGIDDTEELSEILAATTVLTGHAVTAAVLDPAERMDLLRFDEVRVRFRHPLLRIAITQRASVVRRQAAHRAWAAVLTEPSQRRAWHRSSVTTGPDDAVADELEVAAKQAAAAGRLPAAVAALEKSASLTPAPAARARRLLIAADHANTMGDVAHAESLLTAAERTGLVGLNSVRAEVLRATRMASIVDDSGAVERLCDMHEQAAAAGEYDLALKALTTAAQRSWWAATPPHHRARVADLASRSYQTRPDARCVLAVALAQPIRRGTEVMAMIDLLDIPAINDAATLGSLGLAAHAVGDLARAADLSGRAQPELRRQGRTGALAHALGVGSTARLDLGDWTGAAASSAEGSTLASKAGQLIGSAGAAVNQARYLALQGHAAAALQQVAAVEYDPLLRSLNNFLCRAQIVRGIAWISAGRHADAYQALTRVFNPDDPSHHEREQVGAVMYLAEAATRCGKRDTARNIIARMEALTTITTSPLLVTHLLQARAVLADDEDAERLYLAGLTHELSRWPWVRARIELSYGSWLRRQQRKSDARPPLRAALDVFQKLGAAPWAAQARGELDATGEQREPPENTILANLSPQERQIAQLAGTGLSNSEIGQQLDLSPRTVASHLYRMFPKLNITSRAQIPSILNDPTGQASLPSR